MDQFVVVDVQSTMKSDSLATSHPIYVPVQHPDEVNEIFDSISYGKVRIVLQLEICIFILIILWSFAQEKTAVKLNLGV